MSKINYKIINLKPIKTVEKPGSLVDFDLNKICRENNINFTITKSFYINDLNSEKMRGLHSNNNSSEILICLQGSFEIKLKNGYIEEQLTIEKNSAIFIDKNIWIEFFNFKNCIIFAFVYVHPCNKNSCYDYNTYLKNNNNIIINYGK